MKQLHFINKRNIDIRKKKCSGIVLGFFTNYLSILVTNDVVPPNESLVHVVQEPIPLAGILHWPEFLPSF